VTAIEKATSQTFCPVGERNGASLDDFTKWEVAKIAGYSPRLRIKMLQGENRNTEDKEQYEKDVN